ACAQKPLSAADGMIPVAEPIWLHAEAYARLEARATQAVVTEVALWEGLARFHKFVADSVVANAFAEELVARRRLDAQEEADEKLGQPSVARLAAVAADAAVETSPAEGYSDALVSACHLVGHALDLSVRTPKTSVNGKAGAARLGEIVRASRFRSRRVLLPS